MEIGTLLDTLADDLPALLGILIASILLIANRHRLAGLIDRITKLAIPGVLEVGLDTAAIKTARQNAPVSDKQAKALERHIARNREIIMGARILWVDDYPPGNAQERRYLRSAGAHVVNAMSTQAALNELQRYDFDLVITDMKREERQDKDSTKVTENKKAGMDLVRGMRQAKHMQPVIAYIGNIDPKLPTPEGMYTITDRPDQLVHSVLDALAREELPGS